MKTCHKDERTNWFLPAVFLALPLLAASSAYPLLGMYASLGPANRINENEETGKLREIMQNIDSERHARASRSDSFINAADLEGLSKFINQYTTSEAAVTARLYAAALILREGRYEDSQEAVKILEDIEHARPDTWQSALAGVLIAGDVSKAAERESGQNTTKTTDAYEVLRVELLNALPFLSTVDEKTEPTTELFRDWFARTREGNMRIAMLFTLARVNEKLGNIDDARRCYLEIVASSPGTKSEQLAQSGISNLNNTKAPNDEEGGAQSTDWSSDESDFESIRRIRSAALREELATKTSEVTEESDDPPSPASGTDTGDADADQTLDLEADQSKAFLKFAIGSAVVLAVCAFIWWTLGKKARG